MYYDAHTHLNSPELFADAQKYVQNFIDIGWKGMIIVGASDEYNRNAIALVQSRKSEAESLPGRQTSLKLEITLGLHPEILVESHQVIKPALSADRSKVEELKKLILENKNSVVAVGECGKKTK